MLSRKLQAGRRLPEFELQVAFGLGRCLLKRRRGLRVGYGVAMIVLVAAAVTDSE